MLRRVTAAALLAGLMTVAAHAQSAPQQPRRFHLPPVDLAVTYDAERGKIAASNCGCFWFQGGGVNSSITLWHGLGFAADISGGRASDISPGISLSKVNFLFGPRYTWQVPHFPIAHHAPSLFGEFLFGAAHAYGTVIPSASGGSSHATAFAYQTGGGLNLWLAPHFGLRALELDYVHSQLPNNSNSSQNDFRLATGFVWRFR